VDAGVFSAPLYIASVGLRTPRGDPQLTASDRTINQELDLRIAEFAADVHRLDREVEGEGWSSSSYLWPFVQHLALEPPAVLERSRESFLGESGVLEEERVRIDLDPVARGEDRSFPSRVASRAHRPVVDVSAPAGFE
jgi:hypothetical protein